MTGERMVRLATLWERTSQKGTRYFSGFMGDCQLLLFDGGMKPHPTRPDEQVHTWNLLVQERDPARRPGSSTRNAERGQRTWDRARDAAESLQSPLDDGTDPGWDRER